MSYGRIVISVEWDFRMGMFNKWSG